MWDGGWLRIRSRPRSWRQSARTRILRSWSDETRENVENALGVSVRAGDERAGVEASDPVVERLDLARGKDLREDLDGEHARRINEEEIAGRYPDESGAVRVAVVAGESAVLDFRVVAPRVCAG